MEWPKDSPHHSAGVARRLRQVCCSSAIDSAHREEIKAWLATPKATNSRVENVIRWARNLAESQDRTTASLNNRMASLAEKLSYRLDEFERDPSKPIRPILSKPQRYSRQAA